MVQETVNRKSKKRFLWVLYALILVLPCLELALRILGAKPYTNQDYHVSCSPSGAFIGDDSLGIALHPGNYVITLNHELAFEAHHNVEGRRDAHLGWDSTLRNISFFGCSFTYGYGVSDTTVFTRLFEKHFDHANVRNYAVPGHGTVQSFLQLQKAIQIGQIPDVAVFIFSSYHLERNALLNSYRLAIKVGFNRSSENLNSNISEARFPYLREGNIDFVTWENLYSHWMGRETFSCVNYLQTSVERVQDNKIDCFETSLKSLEMCQILCEQYHIVPVFVYLDHNMEIQKLNDNFKGKVAQININFDFQNHELTNYPVDSHPSEMGHQWIAERLIKGFEQQEIEP